MTLAATLSLYVARVFSLHMLAMLAALTCLSGLFDFIELLRRAASRPDIGFSLLASIALLRLPWLAMQILPFAVLLGGIMAFWRLTRSSELIVARASGISAWQFLAAPVVCAAALGVFATTTLSPLSAAMRAEAERLDGAFLRAGGGPLALNGGQLWLRQSDAGFDPKGLAILHASGVSVKDGQLTATAASVFRLDADDHLLERIEAAHTTLEPGQWLLEQARAILPDRLPDTPSTRTLPTSMTVGRVQDSFAPPDTLSFWSLPGFIALLEHSGFTAVRHRLHFQSLLALPLLSGTMALLAACFSMRPSRRGGVAQMIGSGVLAGFALFVVSKVAEEFGQSGVLPPVLAAWAPAASGLLLALALLLHLEDG
jgi:lipopolysaccharide export system permease protein